MIDRGENEVLFHADRTESSVDRLLNLFEETLIMGRTKSGDRISSETEMSRQLSVSRGSVQEAMKILSAFGIVEMRLDSGTFIARSDHKVVFDSLLFSLILSNAKTGELVGNYGEVGVDQLVQSDLDFHQAPGRAAQNGLVEKMYAFVMDFFTPRP